MSSTLKVKLVEASLSSGGEIRDIRPPTALSQDPSLQKYMGSCQGQQIALMNRTPISPARRSTRFLRTSRVPLTQVPVDPHSSVAASKVLSPEPVVCALLHQHSTVDVHRKGEHAPEKSCRCIRRSGRRINYIILCHPEKECLLQYPSFSSPHPDNLQPPTIRSPRVTATPGLHARNGRRFGPSGSML